MNNGLITIKCCTEMQSQLNKKIIFKKKEKYLYRLVVEFLVLKTLILGLLFWGKWKGAYLVKGSRGFAGSGQNSR